jgi:hypothetical protein
VQSARSRQRMLAFRVAGAGDQDHSRDQDATALARDAADIQGRVDGWLGVLAVPVLSRTAALLLLQLKLTE